MAGWWRLDGFGSPGACPAGTTRCPPGRPIPPQRQLRAWSRPRRSVTDARTRHPPDCQPSAPPAVPASLPLTRRRDADVPCRSYHPPWLRRPVREPRDATPLGPVGGHEWEDGVVRCLGRHASLLRRQLWKSISWSVRPTVQTTQSCSEAVFAAGWARMAQKPVVSASVSKLLPTTRFTMVRLLVVPVVEVRRLRMDHPEHGFWRDPQLRADRLDRLPLGKWAGRVRAIASATSISIRPSFVTRAHVSPSVRGVPIGRRSPR